MGSSWTNGAQQSIFTFVTHALCKGLLILCCQWYIVLWHLRIIIIDVVQVLHKLLVSFCVLEVLIPMLGSYLILLLTIVLVLQAFQNPRTTSSCYFQNFSASFHYRKLVVSQVVFWIISKFSGLQLYISTNSLNFLGTQLWTLRTTS